MSTAVLRLFSQCQRVNAVNPWIYGFHRRTKFLPKRYVAGAARVSPLIALSDWANSLIVCIFVHQIKPIMNVYIDLDPYLAQWFVHEQGGNVPVSLMRGSIERAILEQFLQRLPEGAAPRTSRDGGLAIAIPQFKHKPPETYNYLPKRAAELLVSCIRNRFDIDMWTTLHRFASVFRRMDELIWAYMEEHGIEMTETNWNAIAKRYQRKRNSYKAYERVKKSRKNLQESKD